MGGGDDGLPLLSITQSAEPNFLRASALIRLKSGRRIGFTMGHSDWTAAGLPSTHDVPPSGIRVTFTSAKSLCRLNTLKIQFQTCFFFQFNFLKMPSTKRPSGETASEDGSHSAIILQGSAGVDMHRSSSLTVSSELRTGETGLMTVLLRWSVCAAPRRASTRSQSFSSTSSSSGDSSMEPNFGADLHRSTGGLQICCGGGIQINKQ